MKRSGRIGRVKWTRKSANPVPVVIQHKKRTGKMAISRSPVSNHKIVKLRYVETWKSNGSTIDYVFRGNSLFDPNYTGAGHQPLGFDQWTNFYNKYRVLSCNWKLRAQPLYAYAYKIALVPNTLVTAIADTVKAQEQPKSSFGIGTINKQVILKGSMDNAKAFGLSKTEYGDVIVYGAAMTANPSQSTYIHVVYTTQADAAVADGDIYFNLTIDYIAELSDPVVLAQS